MLTGRETGGGKATKYSSVRGGEAEVRGKGFFVFVLIFEPYQKLVPEGIILNRRDDSQRI